MHPLKFLCLVIAMVNLLHNDVSASTYNESAIWNTFLQYASVLKELPSTGQTWELPYEANRPYTSVGITKDNRLDTTYRPYTITNKPFTSSALPGTTTYIPYTTKPPTSPATPPSTRSTIRPYTTTPWPTSTPTSRSTPWTTAPPPTTPSTTPPITTPTSPTTSRTTAPTPFTTPTPPTTSRTTTSIPFTTPSPQPFTLPPYQNTAKMARFVVHFSNWGSLSYQAEQSEIAGYPSVRVYSISDGYVYAGTGEPYFMVSPLDLTIQALDTDERCSLIVSLSQTSYCDAQMWDPEDPRCVQVILTGRFVKLPEDSNEMIFARQVLWDRHPQMISWFVNKTDHHWQFAKLNIEFITVIDYFGGRKYPGLSEYFSAEAPKPYGVEMI